MTSDVADYFLFVGSADSESATTRLRAGGVVYRKKLLNSKPENWTRIVDLIGAPHCRGILVVLTGRDYEAMCRPEYHALARELLDALVARPHILLVHEAVFLTDEQRQAADGQRSDGTGRVGVGTIFDDVGDDDFGPIDDDFFRMDEYFSAIPDDVRVQVNTMMRERELNVAPYRTNVERSILASGFLEDNERHLLFRLYVPSGRLYAQEAEALLGMFREWLGQTGRGGIRQEGYSTLAGQVFEFFSSEAAPPGGLTRSFDDFSSFLTDCVANPESAAENLVASGVSGAAATTIVSRFATRARRLRLDLKQRREERLLHLKHEFENVVLEADGLTGEALADLLESMLPPPTALGMIEGPRVGPGGSMTVNSYSPQFIEHVTGSVVQSIAGTVNLGPEATELLHLAAVFGGGERGQLETAVHELEDVGARAPQRVAARARLKRFLADLGNRGLGIGLDVLQKYVEHKVGVS